MAGKAVFGCNQAGTYLVVYRGEVSQAAVVSLGVTFSLRGALNGVEIPGSQMSLVATIAALVTVTTPVSTSFIVTCNSGDSLTIQFTSTSNTSTITTSGSGTTTTSASLTITRIL